MGERITTDRALIDASEDISVAAQADDAEDGPMRRCLVTRERMAKERMLRFVVDPDGRIVPDLAGRLPGRGMWLSARGDVVETARVRGVFAKAARAQVTVPPDLLAVAQSGLGRLISEQLGLARRAGQAVAGFVKSREWLDKGRASLVVQASDGSAEERERFLGRAAVVVVCPLNGVALGAIFGRDRVVHVAVAAGKLADRIRIEAERLSGMAQPASATGAPNMPRDRSIRIDRNVSGPRGPDKDKVQAVR